MTHRVLTDHAQRLVRNSLTIADVANGRDAGDRLELPDGVYDIDALPLVEDALEKAVADLRHAADELDAERLSCKGWRQV